MTDADDWRRLRRDTSIMDDDTIVALNKPVGLSVMGERHDTDLVRMAAADGETLYPVHRIDKATSGLVLLARRLDRHGDLTRQFQRRTVDKTYLAITRTKRLPRSGVIDLPLRTGRKNRVRVAAPRDAITATGAGWTVPADRVDADAYPSLTRFETVWANRHFTLLALRPVTGRRHQIRVHLAWVGHPVDGDPLFETDPSGRLLLHSWRLAFDAAWRDGERITLEAEPGPEFWAPVDGIDVGTVLDRARRIHFD